MYRCCCCFDSDDKRHGLFLALLIALRTYSLFLDIDLDENEEEMELMEKRVTGILKHSGVDDDDDNNDDDNDNDDNNNNNSDGNNGDNNDKDNSQHTEHCSHSPNNSETKGGSKRVRNTVESNANDENMDTGNVNTATIVHEKKLKKKKIQIPAKEYEEMTQMLALHIKKIVSLC